MKCMGPSLCRSLVFVMPCIESKTVANVLNMQIFPYFGVPRILHLDNF